MAGRAMAKGKVPKTMMDSDPTAKRKKKKSPMAAVSGMFKAPTSKGMGAAKKKPKKTMY